MMKSVFFAAGLTFHYLIQDVESFSPNRIQTTTSFTSSLKADRKPSFSGPDIDLSSFKNPFADFDISRLQDGIANFDLNEVVSNVRGDNEELGSRGEIYFVAQAVLIAFIVIGGVPFIGDPLWAIGGPGLLLGGGLVTVQSFVALGSDSLSPFPAPPATGTLKTDGIYSQMRHPMYTGLLMIMLGLSISTNSADRLLLTALLTYLVEVKSSKEELYLLDMYGQAYYDYMQQVPGKFLPANLMDNMPWNMDEN